MGLSCLEHVRYESLRLIDFCSWRSSQEVVSKASVSEASTTTVKAYSDARVEIAKLNDQLRRSLTGGRVMVTSGLRKFVGDDLSSLLLTVSTYDDFNANNDPYGEHDFGIFTLRDQRVMWKIDYYSAADSRLGSEDPADPTITQRVLTLFLAEEY
jgi:hypothetical protein